MSGAAAVSAAKRRRASGATMPKSATHNGNSVLEQMDPLAAATPMCRVLFSHQQKLNMLYNSVQELTEAISIVNNQCNDLGEHVMSIKAEIAQIQDAQLQDAQLQETQSQETQSQETQSQETQSQEKTQPKTSARKKAKGKNNVSLKVVE